MPRLEFAATVVVRTSPEHAFDYFADYRHVADVLEGVSRWEPVGSHTTGIGARYKVELVAMGFPLSSELQLNQWSRPHEIGWVSESGAIEQDGSFTFTKVPEGVRIDLHIGYVPPASVIGAVVARRLDHFMRERLQSALDRIRDTLEADH